jgi:hypothetical protein
LSKWQKEIGLSVAALYGFALDPETFIVLGSGQPIGYPDLEYDIPEEEWLPFRGVNRDRGELPSRPDLVSGCTERVVKERA